MAKTREELAKLIEGTRFRHKLIGGVEEHDAWRIIKRLSEEYEELVDQEKMKADTIAKEYKESNEKLQAENAKLKLYIKALRTGDIDGK